LLSVLISGPPGSGKTFLAQKFIEHHNIPCIYIRGPEILDKYVGASERGVRELFSRARNLKPCVIFFDEIDSLVPKRGSNQSGVTDRIVNQFLTELDGTEDRSGVFIIATTSRPDLIDKAIIRPGRIDQNITLSYPSIDELKQVTHHFESFLTHYIF
jgi:peroxin-1